MNEYKYSQNFIKAENRIESLVRQAKFDESDTVLDIGAGTGQITNLLLKTGAEVIAIEADSDVAATLEQMKQENPNMTLLNVPFANFKLPQKSFKIFSNIPFNFTAQILKSILNPKEKLTEAYIIVQKEAAEKYIVRGVKNTMWSYLVYPFFDLRLIHNFSKYDFEPSPSIKIVMLKIIRHGESFIKVTDYELYRDMLAHIFTYSNPTIKSSLQKILTDIQLKRLGITKEMHPGELDPEQYVTILELMKVNKKTAIVEGIFKKIDNRPMQKVFRTRRVKRNVE